jgi:hypothetical protein
MEFDYVRNCAPWGGLCCLDLLLLSCAAADDDDDDDSPQKLLWHFIAKWGNVTYALYHVICTQAWLSGSIIVWQMFTNTWIFINTCIYYFLIDVIQEKKRQRKLLHISATAINAV